MVRVFLILKISDVIVPNSNVGRSSLLNLMHHLTPGCCFSQDLMTFILVGFIH